MSNSTPRDGLLSSLSCPPPRLYSLSLSLASFHLNTSCWLSPFASAFPVLLLAPLVEGLPSILHAAFICNVLVCFPSLLVNRRWPFVHSPSGAGPDHNEAKLASWTLFYTSLLCPTLKNAAKTHRYRQYLSPRDVPLPPPPLPPSMVKQR